MINRLEGDSEKVIRRSLSKETKELLLPLAGRNNQVRIRLFQPNGLLYADTRTLSQLSPKVEVLRLPKLTDSIKQFEKIIKDTNLKWKLIDCLIIHRYGKLDINSKIVLVSCFAQHRKDSFESCNFIMDYLKKDAPFWKNEFYENSNEWLANSN